MAVKKCRLTILSCCFIIHLIILPTLASSQLEQQKGITFSDRSIRHSFHQIIDAIVSGNKRQSRGKWKVKKSKIPISVEATMNTPEIIRYRGYPVEIHQVITDDDYILKMHRIPHGKSGTATTYGQPVYLQHGLLDSSACWVISSSHRSLAFRLADLGYDVWLGNFRGNTYSINHLHLNPNQRAFWNFSFDEIGKYDVPAMINYILNQTGRQKLSYVGHSLGSATFFIAMITHPELNNKIDVMMALAPAAALANMRSPLTTTIAPFVNEIELLFRLLNVKDFLSTNSIPTQFMKRFCNKNIHRAGICRNIGFLIMGADSYNLPLDLVPTIDFHFPAGSSVRTVAQFGHNYNTGIQTFIHYDFGPLRNLKKYGQLEPPIYDLKKVTCSVNVYYGDNDFLVTPTDALWVAAQLPNVNQTIRVKDPLYNHCDFLWAIDNNRLLYDHLISMLPPAATES